MGTETNPMKTKARRQLAPGQKVQSVAVAVLR